MTAAISSARPDRPSGARSTRAGASPAGARTRWRPIGVSIVPGDTEQIRAPAPTERPRLACHQATDAAFGPAVGDAGILAGRAQGRPVVVEEGGGERLVDDPVDGRIGLARHELGRHRGHADHRRPGRGEGTEGLDQEGGTHQVDGEDPVPRRPWWGRCRRRATTRCSVPWARADPGQVGDGGGIGDVAGDRLAAGARSGQLRGHSGGGVRVEIDEHQDVHGPDHRGGTGGADATGRTGDDPDAGQGNGRGLTPGVGGGRRCRGWSPMGPQRRRVSSTRTSSSTSSSAPAMYSRAIQIDAISVISSWSQPALNPVMESPSPPAQSPTVTRVNPTCGCSARHASTSLSSAALLTA